jgi:hypothetical protein
MFHLRMPARILPQDVVEIRSLRFARRLIGDFFQDFLDDRNNPWGVLGLRRLLKELVQIVQKQAQ